MRQRTKVAEWWERRPKAWIFSFVDKADSRKATVCVVRLRELGYRVVGNG